MVQLFLYDRIDAELEASYNNKKQCKLHKETANIVSGITTTRKSS